MKRIISVLCVVSLPVCLMGCSDSKGTPEALQTYVMETMDDDFRTPIIQLDTGNKAFYIDHDIYASVLIGGT